MIDQKQAEAQKASQKDHSDMDEKARQEEEQLMVASAAAVLASLRDDKHKDKKSKKERRKSGARSRPGEPDYDIEEMPADHEADKEKKKGQAALVIDSIDSPPKSKSRKKKKDKDATDSGDAQAPSSVPENRDGKTKKNSKRKHADYNADEAPVSAAALAYAYSRYRHPEKWKFNKARQNWITRNVWSASTIPDQHLPLVTWYLKSVKGGVRDMLIEKCQSHAQLSSQPESKPTTTKSVPQPPESTPAPLFGLTPETLGKTSENAAETKRSRAQILLEALQAP
ncbi:DUF2373 domain containing protein [Amanita muscaria]